MVEVLLASWLTALAVEKLAEYFLDEAGGVVSSWCKSLQKLTSSAEYRATTGMRDDLRDGMTAFSASITAVHDSQLEGTATVLGELLALRKSQHHDQQFEHLKTAVDALTDVLDGRYAKGNPKNVGLLESASKSAGSAARTPYGSLATRLQAYRIWVVTSYMHEVMTRTSKDAKEEALYLVGRVILSDPDLLKICSIYAGCNGVVDEPLREQLEETGVVNSPWTGEPGAPGELSSVDAPTVIRFLLEITSSVIMLPPLDQDVSCKHIMEVIGAGSKLGDNGQMELVGGGVVLGRDAPEGVILAMGKYCAGRREVAQMYPTVSACALSAWEKKKERLALDNLFRSMGGKNWLSSFGWTEKGGELRHRYGVAVEDGHVTKICLATNNLEGCIQDDLADCENLRELVLHDNNIFGAIPRRVQRLIDSNPRMIYTGLPLLQVTADEGTSGSSEPSRSASGSGVSSRAERGSPRRSGSTCSFMSSRASSASDSIDMSQHMPAQDTSDGPSGVTPVRRNRSRSFLKRTMSFIKEATTSDSSVGGAPQCTHCVGRNLRVGQEGVSIVCPDCMMEV